MTPSYGGFRRSRNLHGPMDLLSFPTGKSLPIGPGVV